jgi:hypothetical protein
MLTICIVLTSISAIYGVSLIVSGVINTYSKSQVKFQDSIELWNSNLSSNLNDTWANEYHKKVRFELVLLSPVNETYSNELQNNTDNQNTN